MIDRSFPWQNSNQLSHFGVLYRDEFTFVNSLISNNFEITSLRNFINNQRTRMIFARFISLWVREKNRLNVIPACRKRRLKGKPVEEWRSKVNDVSGRRRCLWNLITWIIIKQQKYSKQQRQPGQYYERNRRTCDLLNNDPSLKPLTCKRS